MSGRALPRSAAGSDYPFHFKASTNVPGSQRSVFDALDVDEVVTAYEPPWCKVWETIDEPRLLVIGRYRMGFGVEPLGTGSRARIWIDYCLPAGGLARWLGAAVGRLYARWCTQQILLGIRGA